MCGLWGKALFKTSVSPEDLLHPIRALSHRGPDGYGWYLKDQVALIHTRLSIIDLSGGAQPLQSYHKKIWGVVNGELYDYKKIRDSLIEKGIHFTTKSDSEVLLNLFAHGGIEALKDVSGEFAFIFYDEEKKCLYFGRDPHGVKPLFYELNEDGITLGSEMKSLDSRALNINEDYLKLFIARVMVPPQTFLKNVFHVLPGRIYCLNLETKELSWKYFQTPPLFEKRDLSLSSSLDNLEETLLNSIKKRLIADVEVGCYLSGGIDSALITSMAVSLGARPHAFTLGFSDRDLDETSRASLVAKHLGIDHTVIPLTGKNFFSYLKKSIVAFENPIANPHGAAKNLLAENASKKVKVVLSGEGADEWLGGYSYFRLKKLQDFISRHPRISPKIIDDYVKQELAINMNSLDGKSTYNDKIVKSHFNGIPLALFGRAMKHRMFHYLTNEKLSPFLDQACINLRQYFEEEYPGKLAKASSWDLNSWVAMRTDLLHYILSNVGDRQEMSHSIEGRTPFMDFQLTQVMAKIPEKFLLHGMNEKWALREVAKKYLPQEIWNHHKHPFFAPMKYLYLKEAREGMNEYIEIAKKETPWLNWKHIDRILDQEKLGSSSSHVDTIISMKLILFSTGVLIKDLKDTTQSSARGYKIPHSIDDIKSFRKGI